MKADRNNFNQGLPFGNMMPGNMMMFPNYLNDNYTSLENKVNNLEKKLKTLESRISRIENPYQVNNMQNYQNQKNDSNVNPYQTTQNNNLYNGEMYMM